MVRVSLGLGLDKGHTRVRFSTSTLYIRSHAEDVKRLVHAKICRSKFPVKIGRRR